MGPLNGVRVVEITSVVLGPYAGQLLGDLGADVIKIEPLYGDSNRQVGPFQSHADMPAFYLGCNRNKRSLALDLKTENGLAAANAVISGADVVLHNYRASTIKRLGLDYNSVSAIRPGLIYCATYGFGKRGVYRDRGAFDDSIQAVSGMAGLQEKVMGEPHYLPTLVADKTTALFVVQAVLAALFHRERTGEGQEIEVPMFETMTAWLMVEHLWGQTFEPPEGEAGYPRLLAEFRKPYRCRDGKYLAVLPYRDSHWRAFCEISGRAELAEDPRFCSLQARSRHIAETYRLTNEIIGERTRDEWMTVLEEAGIPSMFVNGLDELIDDPHLAAAEFWKIIESPDGGVLRLPAPPMLFGSTPASIRRPPPRLGEHSVEILREAGVDEGKIRQMLRLGETNEPRDEEVSQAPKSPEDAGFRADD